MSLPVKIVEKCSRPASVLREHLFIRVQTFPCIHIFMPSVEAAVVLKYATTRDAFSGRKSTGYAQKRAHHSCRMLWCKGRSHFRSLWESEFKTTRHQVQYFIPRRFFFSSRFYFKFVHFRCFLTSKCLKNYPVLISAQFHSQNRYFHFFLYRSFGPLEICQCQWSRYRKKMSDFILASLRSISHGRSSRYVPIRSLST